MLSDLTKDILSGEDLSAGQMESAMAEMMSGKAPDHDVAAFLTALANRGETPEEIAAAAKVLRGNAQMITAPDDAVDCCGTGGDGFGTYNISTAVAFVCAAAGVPMAKHGNRSASSKSGAADVLEALGINLDLSPSQLETALREIGFCFLMAPKHHASMRHVAQVRKDLGQRTIFNLLGPLANPAGTNIQLIGVFDRRWVKPMAQALRQLGARRAMVVHGADGLDEISISGKTYVATLGEDGSVAEDILIPEDFGLKSYDLNDLKGGDAQENAAALKEVLSGANGAYRDIVLANAAAVLKLTGKATTLKEGAEFAAEMIESGAALDILARYIKFSQESAAA